MELFLPSFCNSGLPNFNLEYAISVSVVSKNSNRLQDIFRHLSNSGCISDVGFAPPKFKMVLKFWIWLKLPLVFAGK